MWYRICTRKHMHKCTYMSVYMHVYIHTHMYQFACMYVYILIQLCTSVYVYTYTCIHVHLNVHTSCVYMYPTFQKSVGLALIESHMHACIYAYIFPCVYTWTYVYTRQVCTYIHHLKKQLASHLLSHVCMHIYTLTCLHLYTYTHIYTHIYMSHICICPTLQNTVGLALLESRSWASPPPLTNTLAAQFWKRGQG